MFDNTGDLNSLNAYDLGKNTFSEARDTGDGGDISAAELTIALHDLIHDALTTAQQMGAADSPEVQAMLDKSLDFFRGMLDGYIEQKGDNPTIPDTVPDAWL